MKVYTGGSFEIPHIGHINFLNKCAKYGQVTVSLNTDEFIESYKGFKPAFSYTERKQLLEFLPSVFKVIPNIGGSDSKQAILKENPDIIAIGTDWHDKNYCKQMGFTTKWLEEQNIHLCYIPYTPIISTSEIKKRICDQL